MKTFLILALLGSFPPTVIGEAPANWREECPDGTCPLQRPTKEAIASIPPLHPLSPQPTRVAPLPIARPMQPQHSVLVRSKLRFLRRWLPSWR